MRQHASVGSSDLSLLTLLSVVLEGVLQLITSLPGVLGDAELQIHYLLEFRILSWIHTTLSKQEGILSFLKVPANASTHSKSIKTLS